ncbi:MAG: hypothetical protein FWH44_02585 [Methanomassiliicoccaceae archaeon]|nr:hypothetical protein [Methanomassiliicoccaceae archaeon]
MVNFLKRITGWYNKKFEGTCSCGHTVNYVCGSCGNDLFKNDGRCHACREPVGVIPRYTKCPKCGNRVSIYEKKLELGER